MREIVKGLLLNSPQPIRIATVLFREWWWKHYALLWEQKHYPALSKKRYKASKKIKNILIYHISGMSFGGTEKCLQLIANTLAVKYKVFYLYGNGAVSRERLDTMEKNITLIPFSYSQNAISFPHCITEMKPHFKDIITDHNIDLIVTASPGYSHYPWNIIKDIPIILINIFGAPTLQKNIQRCISISNTVREHAEKWTGKLPKRDVTLYAPLAKMPPANMSTLGKELRSKLNIPESDFVFGRIGRNDDGIFDPIGIRAWHKIAPIHPNVHYVIMSPPPALIKIIRDDNIPRVHLLPPSGNEKDVWAFHSAIDAMAHFRRDGETSGVAIAESLTAGNPIITHRSHFWNAHLEYLNEPVALIADLDNVEEYAAHMESLIKLHENHPEKWSALQASARLLGEVNFSPLQYSANIQTIIDSIGIKHETY